MGARSTRSEPAEPHDIAARRHAGRVLPPDHPLSASPRRPTTHLAPLTLRAPPFSTRVPRLSTRIPRLSARIPRLSAQIPRLSARIPRLKTDLHTCVTDFPRLSTDVPRLRTDLPTSVTEVPRLPTDFPRLRTDVPTFVTDFPRFAAHVPTNRPRGISRAGTRGEAAVVLEGACVARLPPPPSRPQSRAPGGTPRMSPDFTALRRSPATATLPTATPSARKDPAAEPRLCRPVSRALHRHPPDRKAERPEGPRR